MKKTGVFHVYNRGVDKKNIFLSPLYYERFLECLFEFNDVEPVKSLWYRRNSEESINYKIRKCLVKIHAFCLLPNHFHLMLEELIKGGIAEFMRRIGIGYTNFFNFKNDRDGVLFQGTFKRSLVDSYRYLHHVYAYIVGNSEIHGICNFKDWEWTSINYKDGHDIITKKNIIKDMNLIEGKTMELYINEITEKAKYNKDFRKQLIDF